VGEQYTSQTCSSCGALPNSRPRGIAGLGIREWTCCACGVTHDRDVNAARNILALGHERPEWASLPFKAGRMSKLQQLNSSCVGSVVLTPVQNLRVIVISPLSYLINVLYKTLAPHAIDFYMFY
jgi:hypothetical protein